MEPRVGPNQRQLLPFRWPDSIITINRLKAASGQISPRNLCRIIPKVSWAGCHIDKTPWKTGHKNVTTKLAPTKFFASPIFVTICTPESKLYSLLREVYSVCIPGRRIDVRIYVPVPKVGGGVGGKPPLLA